MSKKTAQQQLTKANEELSAFTKALIEERKKQKTGLNKSGRIWETNPNQNSLNFYAYNSCNKGSLRTGFNHVQINLVYKRPRGGRLGDKYYKPGQAYYVMEYSKNIPQRDKEGRLPSQLKDTPTAIQLPLDTFNPPQFENNKIKVTYTDKKGKICNVLLGPCNTPEKEQEYKCPVRGVDFVDDDEWKEKVNIWFQTRFNQAKQLAILSGEWQGKEPTLKEAMAPLTDPKTVSENPAFIKLSEQVAEVSDETDKTAEKTSEEAEKHLADAEQQMKEYDKAMEKHDKIVSSTTPEEEEEKIGGKKSKKKRRTKRRKSNRRKKGKKSKKH